MYESLKAHSARGKDGAPGAPIPSQRSQKAKGAPYEAPFWSRPMPMGAVQSSAGVGSSLGTVSPADKRPALARMAASIAAATSLLVSR